MKTVDIIEQLDKQIRFTHTFDDNKIQKIYEDKYLGYILEDKSYLKFMFFQGAPTTGSDSYGILYSESKDKVSLLSDKNGIIYKKWGMPYDKNISEIKNFLISKYKSENIIYECIDSNCYR